MTMENRITKQALKERQKRKINAYYARIKNNQKRSLTVTKLIVHYT